MGGPLLAGITVVALTSLAPMALPLGTRALAITESISLYGGLAVFGGFVLYEYVNLLIVIADVLTRPRLQYTKNPSSCSLG
jgi:growth hormone-inducible transmembrane protein